MKEFAFKNVDIYVYFSNIREPLNLESLKIILPSTNRLIRCMRSPFSICAALFWSVNIYFITLSFVAILNVKSRTFIYINIPEDIRLFSNIQVQKSY